MAKLLSVDEIKEKISIEKEALSILPKNNEKNIRKYENEIIEKIKEYEKYKKQILLILKSRYENTMAIEENKEIQLLKSRIETIDPVLEFFNEYKSSYEKMQLDINIYKIGKFYKDNFQSINEQILECLEKFEKQEINLDLSDFEYSIYVKEYMKVFFENKNDLNSFELKEKFEEIYWKCPDIIFHIELNLRNIYFKYEEQNNKNFENIEKDLLEKWKKSPQNITKSYLDIKEKYYDLVKKDKKIILDKFINGELNTKNFKNDSIIKDLKNIYNNDKINDLDNNIDEIKQNVFKFICSLYEYKNYLEFKFIIDDVKEKYKGKNEYKNSYTSTKKKIDSVEKKIFNFNKKITKPSIFNRNADKTNLLIEQNKLILDLKDLYRELDLNKCYTGISLKLKDNSKIYDALKLAVSNYYYMVTTIIKNQNDIVEEEIEEKIKRLEDFLKSPYNNIINNITILEEKDIGLIIKDKYKLSGFIIEKEDLDVDNLDNLISTLEKINQYFNIKSAKIEIEDVNELLNIKKILKNTL